MVQAREEKVVINLVVTVTQGHNVELMSQTFALVNQVGIQELLRVYKIRQYWSFEDYLTGSAKSGKLGKFWTSKIYEIMPDRSESADIDGEEIFWYTILIQVWLIILNSIEIHIF